MASSTSLKYVFIFKAACDYRNGALIGKNITSEYEESYLRKRDNRCNTFKQWTTSRNGLLHSQRHSPNVSTCLANFEGRIFLNASVSTTLLGTSYKRPTSLRFKQLCKGGNFSSYYLQAALRFSWSATTQQICCMLALRLPSHTGTIRCKRTESTNHHKHLSNASTGKLKNETAISEAKCINFWKRPNQRRVAMPAKAFGSLRLSAFHAHWSSFCSVQVSASPFWLQSLRSALIKVAKRIFVQQEGKRKG